ncbi:MAG: tetratricopeptide repeat protein, partial [Bacteroidetes bacterium]
TDWRGYRALTNSAMQLGNGTNNEEILQLFERWIAIDPSKNSMRNEYLQYCAQMSKSYFQKRNIDSAIVYGLKTIEFDPASAPLYNNVGVLFRAAGNNSRAVEIYKQAIHIDSTFIPSYINLGNACDDLGKPEEALYWYGSALRQDSTDVSIYENMAITYYKLNDSINYVASLTKAARFGSGEARQFLRQMGIPH